MNRTLNLKYKIIGLIIAIILILTAVFGYFMKTAVLTTFEEEIDKRVVSIGKHFAELSADAALSGSTSLLQTHLADYIATESYLAYIIIIDGKNQIQAHSFPVSVPPDILASVSAHHSNDPVKDFRRPNGIELEDFRIKIGTGLEGSVHIGIYVARVSASIDRLILKLTPLVLAVILAGILVAVLLAGAISRPLQVLSDGVEQVTHGNLDFRIDIRARDEIGQLAEAFNLMTANLRESTVSRTFMEKLVNTMNDVLVVMSPEGIVMSVDKDYCKLFGSLPDEVIGRRVEEFGEDETPARMFAAYQQSLTDGKVHGIESSCRAANGEQIPLLLSLAVMRDESGAPQAIICAAQDISAIKKVQSELQRKKAELEELNRNLEEMVSERTAELAITNEGLRTEVSERMRTADELRTARDAAEAANRAKTEFLANMSHEMRTPLNSIIGGTDYLEQAGFPPDQQRCLEMIRQAGDSLLLLVNDLIDLSRIEAGQLELDTAAFDLVATLEAVFRMLGMEAGRKQLEFSLDLSPELPRFVISDQTRLQQVLVNLVANAIKFTASGGAVILSARPEGSGDDSVPVVFEVRDTGIGIEADKIELIFDSFSQADSSITRRFGGSGLGLAISRRLVEAMGGSFRVQSQPGVGSTFSFSISMLPADPDDGEPQKMADNDDPAVFGQQTFDTRSADGRVPILLVDDARENRELMRMLLSHHPLIIDEAANGQEAVELFEQRDYALVLMDIQMPQMDGYAATRTIRGIEEQRQVARRTPIIALTAHAYEADIRKCREAGCDNHIAKPFKKKVLLECLARYLRGFDHG